MWQVGGRGAFASKHAAGFIWPTMWPKIHLGPRGPLPQFDFGEIAFYWGNLNTILNCLVSTCFGTKNLSHLDLFSGVANMQHSFCHELSMGAIL